MSTNPPSIQLDHTWDRVEGTHGAGWDGHHVIFAATAPAYDLRRQAVEAIGAALRQAGLDQRAIARVEGTLTVTDQE